MSHLRLETGTPTETEKAITTLEQENRELKDPIKKSREPITHIF